MLKSVSANFIVELRKNSILKKKRTSDQTMKAVFFFTLQPEGDRGRKMMLQLYSYDKIEVSVNNGRRKKICVIKRNDACLKS